MEEKQSLLDNEQLLQDEAVELPVAESEQLNINSEAKEAEKELEKISAAEQKPLKTKSIGKKWALAALFVCVNLAAVLGSAILEFTGGNAPTPISEVWNTYMQNWVWLVGLLAVFVFSIVFNAVKRYLLLKSTLKKKLPVVSMNSTIVCKYYDAITPLGSGGQPFEIYYLRKKGVPVGIASGVPIVSYCLDRVAFVFVALGSVLWQGFGDVSIIIKVLFILGILVNTFIPFAILFFTIMPKVAHGAARLVAKIGHKLHIVKNEDECYKKLVGSILEYAECLKYFMHKSKARFIAGAVLSILSLVALYSCPYFILRMNGVSSVSWIKILSLTSICYVSVTLLPTPGNAGGAEFSFRSIFSGYLTGGVLFWGMMCWRIVSYYLYIICGFILYLIQQAYKFTKRGKREQAKINEALKKERERRAAEYAVLYGDNAEKEKEELSIPTPIIPDDAAEIHAETTIEPIHPTETLDSHTKADGASTFAEFTAVISGDEVNIKNDDNSDGNGNGNGSSGNDSGNDKGENSFANENGALNSKNADASAKQSDGESGLEACASSLTEKANVLKAENADNRPAKNELNDVAISEGEHHASSENHSDGSENDI
ncbi:MAG: lysylphosphatidylglycerol synthase transmembrane domain-containing protein [Candidatus Borkfalkiaceae bacterium]|nr:lysylphosphatidylglycerol synthase transmembrane domain-containing protein [Christensenellaceae bacterium]